LWFYVSVNSSYTQPPSPWATAGHLPALSVLGGKAVANCVLPRGRALPAPGPPPNFGHTCDFLFEYNYTEDFIGKTSRLAHLSRMGKHIRGLKRQVLDFMHAFLHCLSSQNYIAIKRSY